MTRLTARGWLALGIAVLLVGNVAWRVYAGWGLVTIQADPQPLAEVIRSIERQAHVTLKTDLDPQTPVRLRVHQVGLTEALERLSIVTDARWRLVYVMAGDAPTARYGLNAWQSGEALPNWRWIDHPAPGALLGNNDPSAIPDPRRYGWKIKPPANGNNLLQTYLNQASRAADAAFFIPASWNPSVRDVPASGSVHKTLPKLATAGGGQAQEIFALMRPRRGAYRVAADATANADASAAGATPAAILSDNEEPRRPRRGLGGLGGGPGDPSGRINAENASGRTQERINQLPAEQRAIAQAEFDAEQEFWQSVRDLPAAERAEKVRDHFNDPSMQERLEARSATRDAMRTPEQRLQRARQYVQRRAAAQTQEQARLQAQAP